MGIPIPLFNIPLLPSLIELGNNILETNIIKATKRVINDISKPCYIWLITKINFYMLYIIKTFNTVPIKLDKDLYYIEYFHEGKKYRIVFPIKTYNDINIVKVYSFFNDNSEFMKYLGPNNDFHGLKVTPNNLGVKNVSITYFKEEDLETITKTFSGDNVISLN